MMPSRGRGLSMTIRFSRLARAIGQGGIGLVLLHPRFLDQRRIGPADRQAARRHDEVLRAARPRPGAGRCRPTAVLSTVSVTALKRDPAAGIARHRPAVDAEVEIVLHARRVQHRDHGGGEDVVGLVRQRRGLGGVVVAGHDQHAAMLRGAGVVAVLEHVERAVDAGALAVPEREHAVVLGAREQPDLLRAPDRGGAPDPR